MIRLILRLVLPMMFGNPDDVQQDESSWPTWLVVLIICFIFAALLGGYLWLAHAKAMAP